MILIIDNYDSFTYNLYQYVGEIYKDVKVARNDEISLEDIKKMKPEGIIISPGPGTPYDAGISIEVVKRLGEFIPILGICLGHQSIAEAFGGKVIGAQTIMHGKTSVIKHDEKEIFEGIKNPLKVMRYHSLVADKYSFPNELYITAETDDGVIMAVRHKRYKIFGIQFHPESYFTEDGRKLIKNFLGGICNVKGCY
ncbi:anthranilate synthase component 2 [Clostridium acetobutylicum]|uniref:Para-aminobenzoate synthase component II n=1 Tax=Clostridium acetobutylicum (strain ATCC 824 / DSM 792 / JCM 1419 / IAM 19013 / LMG 5710 / NBRC 13948 / NRRL B-527 / VKM B-1787 / 2291 / W) TaxID=272562 RepID=Q97EF1_CLOAB|nr:MULTISPECIES: aminodeoxychorismate/anthranilate synthase component II [Clostridium]AAK81099.1 Para-aminobenzoate synthase component II [Clostridium acetobutylicum ATCC 824]ADZ22203.1 Para-aminobenzoate synthase component II [Clostridium acetobutylicum EA 2018]AEI33561.1 Para-aminobenzoate synthase component II [Clostridium acetobutylicum DSM 1731]AWV82075.1 aminodeoxychorismate/anthranilate synthase component II [Clostridium acetobutylicum]MBC2393348.1 aminodeoxychorismate/anthranilate synt